MKRTKPGNIPADVYIQFVRSLFNSVHTVLAGAWIHAFLAFLIFWKSGYLIYAEMAVLLLIVGIWRYVGMLKFHRSEQILDESDAKKWEKHYIIRGSVQAFSLGLFCFVAFIIARDHFAEIAAVSILFGSIVTVAGRNYGSPRMVTIFSACFLIPYGLGLILRGDIAHILLGIMNIPFFLIVSGTASQVREVLFSAVIGHRTAKQLAQRFDRALNTMPHGLVMLNPDGQVAVANSEAAHLMMTASPERLLGRSLKSLMSRGVAAGLLSPKDAQFAEAQLTRALHDGRDRKLLLSFLNGRHFEFSTREGNDELGVITFEDVTARVEADYTRKLDAIFAGLQGEVDVAGHCLRIQCSAGAVLNTVGETDVDGMIVKADLALYKAKDHGKNGWRLFESAMDAAFRNRQVMKADLRNAVEARDLRVVYQPIVAMDTMRIASCEALCRWDHPQLGPISPSVFIPLAEEMGIISEISSFMLTAACIECAKWPDPITVCINLSAKDFRDRSIIDKVRNTLAASGLAPHRLEIEVTETALLDDKSLTREYLDELKAVGVRIALDDFGTGYSSLSYLHTLPLDKVKIDRSFLMDVTRSKRSLELLKGIVSLSRPLGLAVTVEGVETFEQLKILALDVKPDLVQGFLFGSALTASGVETMSSTMWPFGGEIENARRSSRR